MSRQSSLRASDADRDQVAERLRKAMAEGRLSPDELDERLGATFAARTYGELSALVHDLPRAPVARRQRGFVLLGELFTARGLIALALLVPLVLVVLATVVFLLTGLVAAWPLWIFATWWFFGHRRRGLYAGGGGPRRSCRGRSGRLNHAAGGSRPRPGFWV